MSNGYDEDKAVSFIRKAVGTDISAQYTDDEILYVVDIIWDYYEKKGFLSLNDIDSEEELMDSDELTNYVKQEVKKDKELIMDPADIEAIVKAELEYEESLENFL